MLKKNDKYFLRSIFSRFIYSIDKNAQKYLIISNINVNFDSF